MITIFDAFVANVTVLIGLLSIKGLFCIVKHNSYRSKDAPRIAKELPPDYD